MGNSSLLHLSFKTSFLIPITLARRVGKLGTLMVDSLYLVFCHKVTLHPHPYFLPKVSSEFHINQDIHLLCFIHNLIFKRRNELPGKAFTFYLDRTKSLSTSTQVFHLYCGTNERPYDLHPKTVQMSFRIHLNLLSSFRYVSPF